jgi:predicted RNA-binding protein (virulence factor B family)
MFLKEISNLDVYGAEIVTVKNKKGIPVNVGASHKGIIVYLSDQSSQIDLFPWSQIGKINLSGNSIIIYFHRPENVNPEEIVSLH